LRYYRQDYKLGSEIFKSTVDYLFKLKQKKHEMAKLILNSLWGSLCQSNKITVSCRKGHEDLIIEENRVIHSMILDEDGYGTVDLIPENKRFETKWAYHF